MIKCQIYIGKGLSLHTLRRINHKYGTVACCKASGNLIIKVDMSRGIDQVKDIFLTVISLIYRTYSL